MDKKLILKIELVPTPLHYKTLRKLISQTEWRKLKEKVFEKEGRKCWICGVKNVRLNLHETWEYDDKNFIQKLKEIHHLCDSCHDIKHLGFATQIKKVDKELLINHFCKVNKCSKSDFEKHNLNCYERWLLRNGEEWKQELDVNNLPSQKPHSCNYTNR